MSGSTPYIQNRFDRLCHSVSCFLFLSPPFFFFFFDVLLVSLNSEQPCSNDENLEYTLLSPPTNSSQASTHTHYVSSSPPGRSHHNETRSEEIYWLKGKVEIKQGKVFSYRSESYKRKGKGRGSDCTTALRHPGQPVESPGTNRRAEVSQILSPCFAQLLTRCNPGQHGFL